MKEVSQILSLYLQKISCKYTNSKELNNEHHYIRLHDQEARELLLQSWIVIAILGRLKP